MELKIFKEPDESFYAIKLDPSKEEYNLEEGDQIIFGYEITDETEKSHWAWANSHPAKGEEQQNIAVAENFDSFSKIFRNFENLTYLPAWTYPSGRAFLAFNSIRSELPPNVDLSIIAGLHPANNWHGVIVKGFDSLVKLQSFLEENDMKVNFDVTQRD